MTDYERWTKKLREDLCKVLNIYYCEELSDITIEQVLLDLENEGCCDLNR